MSIKGSHGSQFSNWVQPALDPSLEDRTGDIAERSKPVIRGAVAAGSDFDSAKSFGEFIGRSAVPFSTLLAFEQDPAQVEVGVPDRGRSDRFKAGVYDFRDKSIEMTDTSRRLGISDNTSMLSATHELGHHMHLKDSPFSSARGFDYVTDPSVEWVFDDPKSPYDTLPKFKTLMSDATAHFEGVADGFMNKYAGSAVSQEDQDHLEGYRKFGTFKGKRSGIYEASRSSMETGDSVPNVFHVSRPIPEAKQPQMPGIRWSKFNTPKEETEQAPPEPKKTKAQKQQEGLDQISRNLTNLFNL